MSVRDIVSLDCSDDSSSEDEHEPSIQDVAVENIKKEVNTNEEPAIGHLDPETKEPEDKESIKQNESEEISCDIIEYLLESTIHEIILKENVAKIIIKQEYIENEQSKKANIREELFMDCDSDSDSEPFSYQDTGLIDVKREAIECSKPIENEETDAEHTKSKDTCEDSNDDISSEIKKSSVRYILFQDSESDSDDFYSCDDTSFVENHPIIKQEKDEEFQAGSNLDVQGTTSYDDNLENKLQNADTLVSEKESKTINNVIRLKNVRELVLLDCSSDDSDLEDYNASLQTQIITAKTELNDSNSQTAADNLINDENESISVVTIIVEELLDGLFIRDQDESFDHNNVEHYHEKELNISQNTNLDDSDPFYNSERGQSLDTANCPNDDLDYEPLENNIGHTADNSINTTRDDFLQETENPIEPSLTKENNVNLDLNFSDISENIETSQDSNDITESHAFNQSNNKNKDEDTMHNNSKTKDLTLHEISNTNICSLNKEPANEYEKDLSDLESFITSIPTVSDVDTAAFIVEELIDSLIYTVVATVEDKAKGVNYIENVEELDSSNINDSSISDLDISGELFDNLEMYDHSTDALNEMINKHLMPSESVIAPVQRTFSVITNTSERSNTPKESSENITVNNSIDIDDLLDGSDEDDCFRPTETANITHPSEPSLDFQIINIKSLKEPPFFTSLLEAKSRQQEPSPKSLKEPPFFTSLLEAKSQQQEPSTSFRSDVVDTTQVHYVLSAGSISSSSEAKSLLPSTSGINSYSAQNNSTQEMKNDSIEIVNHFINSENEEMGFIDDLLSNTKRSEKKPKKIYSWCVDNPTTAVEKSSEEPISNTAIHIPTSSINEQISATSSISENVETSMNEPRLTDLLSTIMENTISSSQTEVPISSIVKAIRSSVAENSTNLTFSSPTSSNASYTYSKSKGRGTQLGSAFRLEGLIEREESTSDIEILSEGPTTGEASCPEIITIDDHTATTSNRLRASALNSSERQEKYSHLKELLKRCVENYPPNVTVTNRHTILNLSNQQSSSQQNSLLSTKEQQKGHKIITKYKEFMYKNFPKLRGRKLNDTKVLQFITTLRKLAAQNKNQQVRHQNLQGNSEVTQEKNSPNQQENQQRQEQKEKNERLSNYFENKTNERNELKKSTYSQSNVEERQQNSWQMVNEQIPLTIEQPRQSPSKIDHIKTMGIFTYLTSFWGLVRSDPGNNQSNEVMELVRVNVLKEGICFSGPTEVRMMFNKMSAGQKVNGLGVRNDNTRKTVDTIFLTDPLTKKVYKFNKPANSQKVIESARSNQGLFLPAKGLTVVHQYCRVVFKSNWLLYCYIDDQQLDLLAGLDDEPLIKRLKRPTSHIHKYLQSHGLETQQPNANSDIDIICIQDVSDVYQLPNQVLRPSASHSTDDIIEIPIVAQPNNDRYDDIVEIPQTDPLALDVTAANISGETIEHTKNLRLRQILAKPAKDCQISTSAQMLNMPTLSTTTVPNPMPNNETFADVFRSFISKDSQISTPAQMLNMPTSSTTTVSNSMPNNETFPDVSSSKKEVPSNSANLNSQRFKILDVNMCKPSSINQPSATDNTTPNPCQTSLAYRSDLTTIGTELDVINNIGRESLYSYVTTCTGSYVVHSDGKTYYTTPAGSFVVASRIERPQIPRRKSKSPGSDNPALPVTTQQPILPTVNQHPLVHPLFKRKTSPNVQQNLRNKSKSPEREIFPMAAARPVVSNNSILQPSGSTSANLVHPLLRRQPAPNSQQISRRKSKSPEAHNFLRRDETINIPNSQQVSRTKSKSPEAHNFLRRDETINIPNSQQATRRKSKSPEVNDYLRRDETSNIPNSQQATRGKSKSPEVNNSLRLDDIVNQSFDRGMPVNRCKTIKNVSLSRRPIDQPENTNVSIDNEERLSTSELALRQSMAFNQQGSSKTSIVTNANRRENLGLANNQEPDIEIIVDKNIPNLQTNRELEDLLKDILSKHCRSYPEIKEEVAVKLTTCPVCHHNFSFAIALMFHLARSSGCASVFYPDKDRMLRIRKFWRQYEPPDKQSFSCDLTIKCKITPFDLSNYILHRDDHKRLSVFPCCCCGKVYLTPASFYRDACLRRVTRYIPASVDPSKDIPHAYHYYPVHPETVTKLLVCPICKFKGKNFSNVLNHIFSTACIYTALKMKDGPDFLELMKNNDGFDPKLITCSRCGLGFNSNILFISHMDHHTNKSKYTCSVCKTSFLTACAFYAHRCGSKEVPHCEFCFAFTDYCGSTKQQAIQNIENVTKSFPDNQPVKDNTAEEGKDRNVSKAQKVIDSQNAELYGKVSVIVPPSSMTNTIGASEVNVSSGSMKIIHPLFSKPKLQQTEKMNNPVNYIRQAETETPKSTVSTTTYNENSNKNEEQELLDIIEGRNASNIVQVNDIDELLLDDSDEEGSANYHVSEKSSDTPTKKSFNVSDRTADSVVESDGVNAKESPLVWIPSDIDLEKSIKHESPKLKSTSTTVFLNPDLSKAFDNINTNRKDSTDANNDRIIANTDIGNKNDDKSEGRSNESHSSGQLKMTIKAKPKNRGPKSRKRPNDTCTESDSEKHEANKKIRKEYELSNDDNNRDLSESNNLEKENLEVNLSQDVESDVDPDDLAYDNMENEFKSSNNTLDKADEEATTPMDVDDTYICMNCSPLLVLRGADGIVDHSTIQEDHVDIRPLWLFNQVNVKMRNVMKQVDRP